MGIEMDAKLDAVHNLFPGPARDAKVGNQSHDWHSKKPMGEKVMDEKRNSSFLLSIFFYSFTKAVENYNPLDFGVKIDMNSFSLVS